MIHNIRKGNYSAQISELGAELKSFKNETTNTEYIWNGDPEFWTGTAPILFPNIGKLIDDEYVFEGKTYEMKKHGFARKSNFDLIEKTVSSAKFVLKANDETLKIYPFYFELEISFEIEDGKLIVSNSVKNIDKKPIYFTIGTHPAFNLPLENATLNDIFVSFDKQEDFQRYKLSDGFFLHETEPFTLKDKNRIYLNADIFNYDALIFKNINSRLISIGSTKSDFHLTLKNTGNAPHIGIWSMPGAPYVCIEPWHGHADFVDSNKEFTEKDSTIKLNIGEVFNSGYEILI